MKDLFRAATGEKLSPEEATHRRVFNDIVASGFLADSVSLARNPGLAGKLGDYDYSPQLLAQLDPDTLALAPESAIPQQAASPEAVSGDVFAAPIGAAVEMSLPQRQEA